MIELANDPNGSRSFRRAAANDPGKEGAGESRRVRSGHAWPFLSPYAARSPLKESTDKPAANDSGS